MTGDRVQADVTWAWHPHVLLWIVVALFGLSTVLLHRRLQQSASHPLAWERRRIVGFLVALGVALVSLGWPLGDLAAHWSVSALVLQRCLLVLAVAPLLLVGLPDDVIWWATRPAPIDAALIRVLRPPVAVICVTVLLVGSMAPAMVAAQSNSMVARGLLALVAVAAGVILWLPIIGRVPGIPRPRPMVRAVYLVAQSVVPVFLSFILILAIHPLYPTIAHSTAAIGLHPVNDQQVAGFVSKLSFLLTLLTVAWVILMRAPDTDDDLGPEDPITWTDIERHFERADRSRQATPVVGAPFGVEGQPIDGGEHSEPSSEPSSEPGAEHHGEPHGGDAASPGADPSGG